MFRPALTTSSDCIHEIKDKSLTTVVLKYIKVVACQFKLFAVEVVTEKINKYEVGLT